MAKPPKPDKKARIRRDPEAAKAHILDAARRLLAERGPDALGLKEIARAAGVSHGLVSHYFGTVENLIETTLQQQGHLLRAEMLARVGFALDEGPAQWIARTFEALRDPLYGRLAVWALISGRARRADFFAHEDQGFKQVVDALVARTQAGIGPRHTRDDHEFAVMLIACAALGYVVGGDLLWEMLGEKASPERERWFTERLAAALGGQGVR